MRIQTIIEHELEITNVKPTISASSVSIYADFKVTHTKGIKNNTITLQNMVRTSPELREYIEQIILNSFSFECLEPYDGHISTIGYFNIAPSGQKKGSFYFTMYLNESTLADPLRAIKDVIGGC